MIATLCRPDDGRALGTITFRPAQRALIRGNTDIARPARMYAMLVVLRLQQQRDPDGSLHGVQLTVGSEEHFIASLEHIEHSGLATVLISKD